MRESKFRGKTINEPIEWVYGSAMVSKDMGEAFIFEEMCYPMEGEEDAGGVELGYHAVCVDPETVGQFVGFKDKNNRWIFEGDKVRILYTDWGSKSASDSRTMEQYLIDIATVGVIVFNEDRFCIKTKGQYYDDDFNYSSIHTGRYGYIEVIGNIHD